MQGQCGFGDWVMQTKTASTLSADAVFKMIWKNERLQKAAAFGLYLRMRITMGSTKLATRNRRAGPVNRATPSVAATTTG